MLIECPECKRSISDKARTCPQCGYPVVGSGDPVRDYEIRKLKRGRLMMVLWTVVSLIWLLVAYSTKSDRWIGPPLFLFPFSLLGLIVTHLIVSFRERG